MKTQCDIKERDCLKRKELILNGKSQRKFRGSRTADFFLLLPKRGTQAGCRLVDGLGLGTEKIRITW